MRDSSYFNLKALDDSTPPIELFFTSRIAAIFTLFVSLLSPINTFAAATCTRDSRVCVDATPCKTISGAQVCLAGAPLPPGGHTLTETCWKYTSSYTCYDPNNSADTCATQKSKGCAAISSVDIKNGPDDMPVLWEETYTCGTVNPGICKTPSNTCTDTTNTLTVGLDTIVRSGAPAVADGIQSPSSCWATTANYTCSDPNIMVNTYAALVSNGCSNTGRVCLKASPDGRCILYEHTYKCSAAKAANCIQDTTATTCADSTTHKLVATGYDIYIQPNVVPTSGVASPSSCWKTNESFICANLNSMVDTCQPLRDQGCLLQPGSTCLTTLPDDPGACTSYQQTYQCGTTAPPATTDTTCSDTSFCINGTCFDLAHPQNQDMSKTAAMMEVARQAGNYQDPATMQFFKGTGNSCENKLGGLFNCCTVGAASGKSNAAMLGTSAAINLGSPYVMDALGASTGAAPSLFSQAYGFLGGGAVPGTTPFSMMGVTVNFGAGASQAMFAFDPTSLAISLAIMVVTELLSCTQDEKMLSMKRGERLCIGTGSYCSLKVPVIGICLATTETYCCYNSRLARIINQQGKAQLGTEVNTSCAGFTQAELSSIDFSTMDLTEFMAEIQSEINIPAIQASMQSRINTMGNANGATSPTANTPVLNPNAAGGYTGGFRLVEPP